MHPNLGLQPPFELSETVALLQMHWTNVHLHNSTVSLLIFRYLYLCLGCQIQVACEKCRFSISVKMAAAVECYHEVIMIYPGF